MNIDCVLKTNLGLKQWIITIWIEIITSDYEILRGTKNDTS